MLNGPIISWLDTSSAVGLEHKLEAKDNVYIYIYIHVYREREREREMYTYVYIYIDR